MDGFIKILMGILTTSCCLMLNSGVISAGSVGTEFVSGKTIYSDEKLEIICEEITPDGIEFQAVNKTKRDLMISLTVSLDGVLQATWADAEESTVSAGDTKEFMEYFQGESDNLEHGKMSLMGSAYLDGVEYTTFEATDVDLGGISSEEELQDGDIIYQSDTLEVEFVGLTAWGVALKVDNKSGQGFWCHLDDMIINGDIQAYGSAFEMPGDSVGICEHNITYYTDITGDDIQSFTASFTAELDGRQETFNFSYDDGQLTSDGMQANAEEDGSIPELTIPETEETSEVTTNELAISETEEASELSTASSDSDSKNNSKEAEKSITEQTYTAATTMTKADLDGSEGKWSYKGIKLVTEDCDWVDDSLNTTGSVNQGAIYRKMAMLLDGFDMKITNLLDYSELLTGRQISSRDEMAPYVENLQRFIICDEGPEIVAIMKKLEQNSFVSGTFDYSVGNLGSYSIDITDLKQCAVELETSEEMLGYILAELSEYAPEITFGENSCHIEYQNTFGL